MKLSTLATALLSWTVARVTAGKLSTTDTITWGGDSSRSGYQSTHNMDPAVVGSAQFGQLWKAILPGNYGGFTEQIYSQPLLYTLNDGIQYVFIATTQNNVYKINAKTGTIVDHRSLHIPFLTSDLGGCVDINPTVGVTATGVIDPDTDTWYLTAKTYVDQNDQVKGRQNGRYYFHAIDVNTLTEKSGFPKDLEGTLGRNNPNRMFQGGIHHQRPALLQSGQYIYAGFASHCVQWNFTGWIMGWDKDSGSIVEHFTTEGGKEPNTVPGGGVWMSGGGLATDGRGSMYFSTGNGYASQLSGTPVPGRQPPTDLEEAAVNMKINEDGSLSIVDFFMPWEKVQLDGADKDLGTTPLELLQTDVFTCPNVKRMGVVTGKSGKTYILNLDNLGGYQEGTNKLDAVPQVWQNENSVYAGAGVYPGEGGYIYINVIQYPTHVYKFSCDSNGNPRFIHVADTNEKNAYVLGTGHGTTTSLNGQQGTGLYWVTDVDGYNLRIYNAVPENGALTLIKTANIAGVTKFARPVFGDGRAYVGTIQGALYCFGSPVNLPMTCSSPNDFGNEFLNSTSAAKTIQCKANVDTQITSLALKGNPNFQVTSQPTLPASISKGSNFSFQAVFKPRTPGPLSSDVLLGTVNGLTGYSTSTPVSLKGNGDSLEPLFSVSPNTVSFSGVITGQQEGGVMQSAIFTNAGDGPLHITGIDYSVVHEGGATVTPNTTALGPQVGPFTFQGLPSTIPGNSQATVNINFNPSKSGNYAVYLTVHSDGGNKILDVVATAGTYPEALLEFQAADGSGKWIPYTNNSPPFTFGNVYEATTKSLKMRLTNNGSSDAASLSVTVSKPPFGVPGIVGAQNQVDIAEGTVLAAGESATAVLYCSVPNSQVNVDSYNGSAQWTMNTGDPNFGKQYIQFTCNAIAEQVGPLASNGSAIYRYEGCWKENNPGRQLTTQLWGQNPDNTNDLCINACASKGYAIAGTQYNSECWCSPKLPVLLANETDCNYECSGNVNETCGGNGYFHDGSYISLFNNGRGISASSSTSDPGIIKSVGGYNYSGCATEATVGRALGAKGFATSDMTLEYCAGNCTGYQLFGYCGNSLGVGSVKAPDGDCSKPCSGKTSENCGNGNRLSLYSLGGKNPFSSASSSVTGAGGAKTTTASTSKASTTATGPSSLPSAGSFSYIGCYTEGSSGRSLDGLANPIPGATLTNAKCAAACSTYKYFGTEYSGECYCGNTIGIGSVLAAGGSNPDANGCSMTCNGDTTTYCGGANRLNMYAKNSTLVATNSSSSSTSLTSTSSVSSLSLSSSSLTTSTSKASPTGPVSVQTAGSFSFQGCLSEGTSDRALASNSTTSDSMTVAKCATFCSAYKYMGVEYSSECYCADSLSAGAVASTGCDMTCSGDSTSLCGGPNRLSFYQAGASVKSPITSSTSASSTSSGSSTSPMSSSSSTSTTSTTKPSGPSIVQKVGAFRFQDCYAEATTGRALSAKSFANDSMTVEACSTYCTGYSIMGVEYGRECYCDNSLNTGSLVASSGCSMVCSGDETEYCGGPNRLNLYSTNTTAKMSSSSASSITSTMSKLSTSSQSTSKSSISSTATSKSSSTTSSLSSSSKISSSSSISPTATSKSSSTISSLSSSSTTSSSAATSKSSSTTSSLSSSSTTSSSTVTSKSSSTTLTLSSSSTTSSSTTTKSSATISSSAAATPGNVRGNANYSYTACYTDSTGVRSLPYEKMANNAMTVESCLEACSAYTYVGLEYGRECWCGNTLASTAVQATAESQCGMKCSGNSTELCGGSNRLSLYTHVSTVKPAVKAAFAVNKAAVSSSATESSSRTQSTTMTSGASESSPKSSTVMSISSSTTKSTLVPTPSQTVGSYVYLGCANQTSPLALVGMSQTSAESMTNERCQAFCLENNYGLAATQDGTACYCGNGLQSYSAVGHQSCKTPCSGNSAEICGGKDASGNNYLSVWNSTSTTFPVTTVKQVGYYVSQGCYSSTQADTPILNGTTHANPTGESVESCVGYCITKGYSTAGVQEGACYCDSGLAKTAKKEAATACDMPCAGNKREFCGASGMWNVYEKDPNSVDSSGVQTAMNLANPATISANLTSAA